MGASTIERDIEAAEALVAKIEMEMGGTFQSLISRSQVLDVEVKTKEDALQQYEGMRKRHEEDGGALVKEDYDALLKQITDLEEADKEAVKKSRSEAQAEIEKLRTAHNNKVTEWNHAKGQVRYHKLRLEFFKSRTSKAKAPEKKAVAATAGA